MSFLSNMSPINIGVEIANWILKIGRKEYRLEKRCRDSKEALI